MANKFLFVSLLAATATPVLAQTATTGQAPQPVTKAAFTQRIDSAFASVDANKDGSLDRAEIEADQTRVMNLRKAALIKEREAAFRQMDANKDGQLTLAEFNAALVAAPLPKANATPILTELDANKDGRISAAENRAPRLAQFDRIDTNKDGTLSVEEQRAAAAAGR